MVEGIESRKGMGIIPAKISGLSGILAAVCFLVGYSIAWYLSSSYVFGESYLSDLGIQEGALSFNLGLMVTPIVAIPFFVGMWNILREHILGKLGSLMLLVAGVSLFLIGLFPEDMRPTHYIVSVAFFFAFAIALLVLALPMIRSPAFRRVAGPLTVVIIFSYFLAIPLGMGPLMETIAVFEAVIWILVTSVQMILFARSENRLQESLE